MIALLIVWDGKPIIVTPLQWKHLKLKTMSWFIQNACDFLIFVENFPCHRHDIVVIWSILMEVKASAITDYIKQSSLEGLRC